MYDVKRFASEYQKTMPRATGDSARQIGFRRHAATTNTAVETTTNTVASTRLIAPRGISRLAVRGFSASKRASTSRLNPMADERAATIATRIQPTTGQVIGVCLDASSAPASANGSANTEWLKRTNDR